MLAALGIFGASLFFGDSIITPAISVLSAVEGLEVVEPTLEHLVVPIAAVILVGLFAVQRLGTEAVGRLFGPVMLGLVPRARRRRTARDRRPPGRPARAVAHLRGAVPRRPRASTAYLALGGVVLAVTGAEALYADMGHFGRAPIRRAWMLIAFPALTLNYLGPGRAADRAPARRPRTRSTC